MEYRQLGASGLKVPVLSLGTATFGGRNDFFRAWGNTQLEDARRMVQLCMDAGVNLFDSADIYSGGVSEEILGQALTGLRNEVLISTKTSFKMSDKQNDSGSSRLHILKSCEDSLRRLKTDHIDIYHMHGFDGNTPVEETLRTLDTLIASGKIRYIACSNFSGWHLMKSLSASERYGWSKYVAHQAYYSLLDREFEWELMPLGLDQKISTLVWSPLSSGRLTGKFRRGQPLPENNRISQGGSHGPATNFELLYTIVDALDEVAEETGRSISQISINWLLQRPTIASILIGARDEGQLIDNLAAATWKLTSAQVQKLDAASQLPKIYPYWHQAQDTELNPLPEFYKS